jgi:hypothetical protein
LERASYTHLASFYFSSVCLQLLKQQTALCMKKTPTKLCVSL